MKFAEASQKYTKHVSQLQEREEAATSKMFEAVTMLQQIERREAATAELLREVEIRTQELDRKESETSLAKEALGQKQSYVEKKIEELREAQSDVNSYKERLTMQQGMAAQREATQRVEHQAQESKDSQLIEREKKLEYQEQQLTHQIECYEASRRAWELQANKGTKDATTSCGSGYAFTEDKSTMARGDLIFRGVSVGVTCNIQPTRKMGPWCAFTNELLKGITTETSPDTPPEIEDIPRRIVDDNSRREIEDNPRRVAAAATRVIPSVTMGSPSVGRLSPVRPRAGGSVGNKIPVLTSSLSIPISDIQKYESNLTSPLRRR